MREPYPVALAPLLSQFLGRRRAKSDYPLRAMERLGLDRPAYFQAMDLGTQDPRGALPKDIGNSAYRTTDEPLRAPFAAAESVGLVKWSDDRWSLTEKGTHELAEFRRAMEAHYASLTPIAADEVARLAGLFDSALGALSTSSAPKTQEHTPRAARYRYKEPSSAMARLDAAIYGLWQARDDCHMQAWRDAGLAGPIVHLMTAVWHKEAASDEELASKITTQRPDDVRAGLQQLRASGSLSPAPGLALTEAGTKLREGIEADTDRYFFGAWPDAVGAQAAWMIDRLTAVNAGLA
jgi:hypothetical protein